MRVLIVRHGDAGSSEEFARTGKPDEERPLTADGQKEMRVVAAGLKVIIPELDRVATSPLVRAAQTAAIVGAAFDARQPEVLDALAPGGTYGDVLEWLKSRTASEVVALVGHEPDLGGLASWLVSGKRAFFVQLKKGAACLLEFADKRDAGSATLLWSMTPRHLKAIARG